MDSTASTFSAPLSRAASPLPARAGAAVLALVLVAAGVLTPTRSPEAIAFGSAAGVLAVATMGVAVVPEKGLRAVQLAALASVWVCLRMTMWTTPAASWVLFGAPLIAVLAAWALPMQRRRVRLGAIVLVTAAIPLLLLAGDGWPYAEYVLGAALQFLVLGEHLGRTGRRPLKDVARYLFTGNTAPATPVPVEDVLATDRAPETILRGGAWVALGLFLLAANGALRVLDLFEPWTLAREGAPVAAFLHGVGYWSYRFLRIAGVFLVDVGCLRMLGVPARDPVAAPWRSRDFLDYWKRANVYRYKMLSEVYFRNFFPVGGRWMPAGVLGVFLVSGLHHMVTAPWAGFALLRWGIDGVISAATAAYKQARARAGVKAYVSGKRRAAPPRWVTVAWAVALPLVVLSAHGFLMELSRPDKALRLFLWQFLPRGWFV